MPFRVIVFICFLTLGACRLPTGVARDGEWNEWSGRFRWMKGHHVDVPRGFTYHPQQGIDSYVGYFASPDGQVVIKHDIGMMAGIYAAPGLAQPLPRNILSFEQRCLNGSRILIERDKISRENGATLFRAKLSLPDADHANFFVASEKEGNTDVIDDLARSYRGSAVPPRCFW